MNIGEKIQICRKAKRMSQEELGELLMVSRQTISLWENGLREPKLSNLIALAKFFRVSIDFLAGLED